MRTRLGSLAVLLLLTGCASTVEGSATPGGALLQVRSDTYVGLDDDGGGGRVSGIALDSSGAPVVIASRFFAGQPHLTRGTDLAGGLPIDAFADNGTEAGFALAPDDTAVVLGSPGSSGDVRGPLIVRISPDGTQQVVPLQLTDDPYGADWGLPQPAEIDFSDDATRAVRAVVGRDSSQGFPLFTGTLDATVLDTTTGAVVATAALPVFDPAADVPGTTPPLTLLWTAATPDGGMAIATVDDAGVGEIRWLDASLALVATTTGVPGGWVDTAPDGTVLVATPEEAGSLYRVAPRAPEPERVADLPADWFRSSGLAVDDEGTRVYVTGALGVDADFPEAVLSVDLTTGTTSPPVVLCADGDLGAPAVRADTLLVTGTCSDDASLQVRVYLLGPAD